ncbi:MAG: SDR family oxidoreductase [Actinomycetota bacterium]|nr:SDR family oxidoreductase [Actinomycetota bacterium]
MAPRTVLISGSSSGIGRATAVHLARSGWDVFAGVRKVEDGESLRSEEPDRIHPVILDVTDQATIDAAAVTLEAALGDRGLDGLVNNAGIAVAGPLEFLPVDELRRQLEVNVVGQIAVTQAMMPAIRRATGRIVNISSVGGRLAHPFMGPYHASKFAIEALTDTLRKELRRWGIVVVAIEPGTTDSAIWEKGERGADALLESIGPRGRELYGGALEKIREMVLKAGEHGRPAEGVATVIERALTTKRPRTRYLVGRDAWAQVAMSTALPDRAVDALEARYLER